MVEERKVWPNLSPAAIGLIGVLFGPVISTGANYLVFSGKEAIEAAKAELSRTTELKIAIRVLTQELEEADSSAVMLYQQRVWSHISFRWMLGDGTKKSLPANCRQKIGINYIWRYS